MHEFRTDPSCNLEDIFPSSMDFINDTEMF